MTDFNGGSVFIEIPILLSADSGSEKHLDLDEQGAWLYYEIKKLVDEVRSNPNLQGIAIEEPRYWGTKCAPTDSKPVLPAE
ncbi:hypothetical protein [Streptomyces sp. ok210]|uniref:hypothetical protein n=1 Tax=Streptomyces sp. ok210 TaxID=1761905 RepID=UPI0008DFD931|nr:hypothetical protein [Streptomyces sp. ok210]SFS73335.1 hypothetical protein SAMN04487982_103208 [Streptomyces sp. ok210]